MARDWRAIPREHFTAMPAPASPTTAAPDPLGTLPLFDHLPPTERTPVPEQLITRRCAELYPDDGAFAPCQKPTGHGEECGPDPDARPYFDRPPIAPAVLQALTEHRGQLTPHPSAWACCLAYAVLWDLTGQTVRPEDISARVGLAPATVKKYMLRTLPGSLAVPVPHPVAPGWRPRDAK